MITMPRCLAFLVVLALASGTTVATPILSVSRTVIDWGNVSLGVPTGTQSFDVTNVGDAPLALTGFGLIGSQNYALGGPCNSVFTLDKGASCRFDITLTVTNQVAGPITARIDIDSNGGPTAQVQLRAFNIGAGSAPPATSPDLNQHGLTGSWYEPATSGQGFAVQIIPNQTPGNGVAFVSWFTFDTVIGGAEHQRWYTLQGPVITGQPSASLTIYQNTGGNFNAPPATNAQAVGTATLSFDTCSSGELSYSFTDGTGRAGTVPLTRLLPNVICSVTTPYPTNADFAFSGSWYAGAATSGQGLIAEVAPNSSAFFLSWFTYMPNGANAGAAGQRWYTAQGAFTPGLRTISVQIYETTGGKFDTSTPPGQGTVQVGSGTMTFQSCSAATFNYNFTGGSSIGSSGTIALGRVGPVPPGCTQ